MPFSFKPPVSQAGNGPAGSSFSFGGSTGDDLMARTTENGFSLLRVLIYFLFGISCFIAVFLFGYRYYLNSQIKNDQAEIAKKETELAAYPIEDMRSLSIRIRVITQLLNEHPYVNAAFRILEDSVENQITYKSFNLSSLQGRYKLVIQGVSPDYKSIAQQVDTLRADPYKTYIGDIKVDGLELDDKGQIAFSLEMPINIIGTLPEDVNLSHGVSLRTMVSDTSSSTPSAATSTGPTITR